MSALTPELLGLPAFLILTGFVAFITGLLRGWWVLGRECESLETQLSDMKSDRDYWRNRVERGTALAEQATNLASRTLPPITGGNG